MASFETRSRLDPEQRIDGLQANYPTEWRDYASRRRLALFLLCSWTPGSIALFGASRYGLHQPLVCGGLICLWLAAALAAVWWAGEFRCPRCRRRYGALGGERGTDITRGLFDQACANCKLTKSKEAQGG